VKPPKLPSRLDHSPRVQPHLKQSGGHSMTVCVAAISNVNQVGGPTIVTASDRMITFNDVEYEPATAKACRVHPLLFRRALCFFAGDLEPFTSIRQEITTLDDEAMPQTMKGLASLFAEKFADYRRLQAERKYLSPLGINSSAFFDSLCAVSEEKFAQTILNIRNMCVYHYNVSGI
jgi:hypothetical protein